MLSLFGYDPEGDHYRITREQGTRRINLAIPEESMLVEKPLERYLTPEENFFPNIQSIGKPW